MKVKNIILVVIFFMFSHGIQGQAALFALIFGDKVASENFNISLEVGGTLPTYSNVANTDNSNLGINFGIGGNAKITDNWYISPQIYFLARRSLNLNSFSLNSGNQDLDAQFMNLPTQISINAIDIPILISYQTNNKKYRFSLAPQISFLQKSKAKFTSPTGEFTQELDGYTADLDYGIMADFGYILGKAHQGKGVHLHLRYYYGFKDVLTNQISTATNQLSYFSLHLSLPFITDELAAKNLENN